MNCSSAQEKCHYEENCNPIEVHKIEFDIESAVHLGNGQEANGISSRNDSSLIPNCNDKTKKGLGFLKYVRLKKENSNVSVIGLVTHIITKTIFRRGTYLNIIVMLV